MTIDDYFGRTAQSRDLFERASGLFPNGVTHVARFLEPHPIYVSHAAGPYKWDVDGNRYIDYLGGHGALLLGHCRPEVVAAVAEQSAKGAHYGASHALEVEWAELVRQMVPCAERVRFTVTGTEATHLGLRLARAFTGRPRVLRFAGHFHGWHDQVSFPPGGAAGISPGMCGETLIAPPNDIAQARELLENRDDIAAVILEPTGATFGHVPAPPEFVRELREITAQCGVILIFDEVVCGFRCSPGGAQGHLGITPDLASLAKILAGGYPGAAIAGRADILAMLDYRKQDGRITPPAVPHQGTYNAGPVSAAAGIATLKIVRDTDAVARANRTAALIRDGMNEVLRRKGIGWVVYGRFSDFHVYAGTDAGGPQEIESGKIPPERLKGGVPAELLHKIRVALLCEGVDTAGWPGGLVSAAHTDDDAAETVAAFSRAIDRLAADGDIP